MSDQNRDPYAAPHAPRERGGPMLRFVIVASLLAAGVWAYLTFSQGPEQTNAAREPSEVADASRTRGYTASPAEIPEAAPPPEAPAPDAPRSGAAPPPAAEPAPAPSTTTVPPA